MGYRLVLLVTVGLLAVWLAHAEDSQGDGMRPQHYGDHRHAENPDRIRYWDLLLNNPRGAAPPSKPVAPSCEALGAQCPDDPGACCSLLCAHGKCCQPTKEPCPSAPAECCSGQCAANKCCQSLTTQCSDSTDCCSGGCVGSRCCKPDGDDCEAADADDTDCCSGFCQTNKKCAARCFAANTMVHIKESPTPIPIQDLQTGQHVLCMDTTEDMRLPTKAKYCKMLAWLHAKSVTYKQSHIEYLRPNGAKTTLKLSPSHFMVRLTSPDVIKGSTAASLQDFGRFESMSAKYVRAGDILAVLTDETDPMAGFTAVTVEATATEDAEGLYTPLLESPYIIADGVVVPSNINQNTLVAVPEGMDGAKVASHHYLLAPAYMRPAAPGLAGKDAHSLVPDAVAIDAAVRPLVRAGKVLNYTALREWWLPRHQAWKADPTKVTLVEEVLAWLTSDAAWQPRTAEPHKEQWIVQEQGAKPASVK